MPQEKTKKEEEIRNLMEFKSDKLLLNPII